MKKKIVIAVWFVLGSWTALWGQSSTTPALFHASIRIVAKAYGDSIVLRWAPSDQWAWSVLNKTGYILEKVDKGPDGRMRIRPVTTGPIKPMTLEQMKAALRKDDKYAAIAAQCLYGTNFATNIRQGQAGNWDQANVLTNRFGFALQAADFDPAAARAMGLGWVDRDVQPGQVYGYLVCPAVKPSFGKIDTGSILLKDSAGILHSKPRMADAVSGDHKAELHWVRIQQEGYTAYNIERSDDGRNFRKLNDYPFYSTPADSSGIRKNAQKAKLYALLQKEHVFSDSLPLNYHRYYYRITGVNAFGEWSNYSDTITVSGIDLTPPMPALVYKPKYIGGRSFLLRWSKPFLESDLKGWLVTRSTNIKGPYHALTPSALPPGQTLFTDTAAIRHKPNYYIVIALDTAGNPAISLPATASLPDTVPPLPPIGLAGRIDTNGHVFLSWKKNAEEDIRGYKVYFANADHHPFTQATHRATPDTSYVDTLQLKTLSKYVYYCIIAVDNNNNHSRLSMPLRLKRPDIVPPMPPVVLRSVVDSAGVRIDWSLSPDKDVVAYVYYRRSTTDHDSTSWAPYLRHRADTGEHILRFRDSAVKVFTHYQYYALAIDEDSLRSRPSPVVSAAVMTAPPLPPLKDLTASYDAASGKVKLHWQYQGTGAYYFILYRGTEAAVLTRLESLDKHQLVYTDTPPALTAGSRLRYAIQAQFTDGQGKTRLSDPVTVTIGR